MGSHSFPQGIFPTQGLNPGHPHYRQIFFYHLSPREALYKTRPVFKCTHTHTHKCTQTHTHTHTWSERLSTLCLLGLWLPVLCLPSPGAFWSLVLIKRFLQCYFSLSRSPKISLIFLQAWWGPGKGNREDYGSGSSGPSWEIQGLETLRS